MSSNTPYTNQDASTSESNVPLVPKPSPPKDFEAAAAALMLNYGSSGTAPIRPHKVKKDKKDKKGNKKSKTEYGLQRVQIMEQSTDLNLYFRRL